MATVNKKAPPAIPFLSKPCRKPKNYDPDDFSDDDQYYKHRNQVIKYKHWRYGLLCEKNVVQNSPDPNESPRKESPTKISR